MKAGKNIVSLDSDSDFKRPLLGHVAGGAARPSVRFAAAETAPAVEEADDEIARGWSIRSIPSETESLEIQHPSCSPSRPLLSDSAFDSDSDGETDDGSEDEFLSTPQELARMNRMITRLATTDLNKLSLEANTSVVASEVASASPTAADIPDERTAGVIEDLRELANSQPLRKIGRRRRGTSEVTGPDSDQMPVVDENDSAAKFMQQRPTIEKPPEKMASDVSLWNADSMNALVMNEDEPTGLLRSAAESLQRDRAGTWGVNLEVVSERCESSIDSRSLPSQSPSELRGPGRPAVLQELPTNQAEGPRTLWGALWKKRANISKSAKFNRMFIQEAQHLFMGGIRLDRLGKLVNLSKEVMMKKQNSEATDSKEVDDENMWDLRQVCLTADSKLSWGKLATSEDALVEGPPGSPSSRSTLMGGLALETPEIWGSTVEFAGEIKRGNLTLYTFKVYLPPNTWRDTLNFASENPSETERWIQALTLAARFPLPKPMPNRGCCMRAADFCRQRGPPPKHEPPPSILSIEILCASGLDINKTPIDDSDIQGIYVVGSVHQKAFRTATRQRGYRETAFGNAAFHIPVEKDDVPHDGADDAVHFEVIEEPQYVDKEARHLGAISLPLFKLGRNQPVALVLPMKHSKRTRSGYVTDTFGSLVIVANFHQPLGHLWLPVEPSLNAPDARASKKDQTLDVLQKDLEMQGARIDALVQLVLSWISAVAFTLQWQRVGHSLRWFIFLQLWAWELYQWSLPIIVALILLCTLEQWYYTGANNREMNESNEVKETDEMLRASASSSVASASTGSRKYMKRLSFVETSSDLESGLGSRSLNLSNDGSQRESLNSIGSMSQLRRKNSKKWPSRSSLEEFSEAVLDPAIGRSSNKNAMLNVTNIKSLKKNKEKHLEKPPDAVIWEAQRRIVWWGFASEYLHDFDPPKFANWAGEECEGPKKELVEKDGQKHRYNWQVVEDQGTDENGWQYAARFDSEHWFKSYDAMYTWVRRRKRFGWKVGKLQRGFTYAETAQNQPDQTVAAGFSPTKTEGAAGNLGTGSQGTLSISSNRSNVETMLTDQNVFGSYFKLYRSIRDDVVDNLSIIEKHKNLFTFKDETVSKVILVLLLAILALTLVVDTHIIFSIIVILAFYIGMLMGGEKKRRRKTFMESLSEFCSEVSRQKVELRGRDNFSALHIHGITNLSLRDWCNKEYELSLDLRTVNRCERLGDLADIVVQISPEFPKAERRYRAWHSDFYQNFLDHVPSDMAEHDPDSVCYVAKEATSLINVV